MKYRWPHAGAAIKANVAGEQTWTDGFNAGFAAARETVHPRGSDRCPYGPGLTDLWAFTIDHANDPVGETILATRVEQAIIPCVAGDMERVNALRPSIPALAGMFQCPARLVKWSGPPRVVEIIKPGEYHG